MSDTFEEVNPLHSVLNRDLRNVESDFLYVGRLTEGERGEKCLHTLLTESLLPLRLLRP